MSNRAIAEALAAGRVPDDVDRAKLYESTDNETIAAVIFVGSFTAMLVSVRLASRVFIVKRFGIDDALALFGLITLIAFIVLCVILIRMGSGRHFEYVQYVMTLQTVENSEIVDFAAHLIYTSSLLIGRLSGLAFYYRLCQLHNTFRLAIFVVGGIIVAGFLPQIFLIIFHCVPVTGLWPYEWQPGVDKYTCLEWGLVYSVNSATSLLCDFLIFGIPIAMLRGLDMPRKRKIQLTCILLPGVLVICISITRLVFVIKGQWEADMSWSYNPMLGIEVSEIGGTLIALSVPGIKPVFDLMFGKLRDASKESYGSARSRFQPHSQHLSSTENLKELHMRRSRRAGGGGSSSSTRADPVHGGSGSGGAGCRRDFGLESAGNGRLGHGAGAVAVAAKKESISTVGSVDDDDTNNPRPGSDAILVQVDFGINEERGSPMPKDYGLKHFRKDENV